MWLSKNLQRNKMKLLLKQLEIEKPGRKEVMIRALAHIRPSHLLDNKIFDFSFDNIDMELDL